ncbi:MAG: DUF3341 domain-containing protein [Gammaproteobacteria bacterium]
MSKAVIGIVNTVGHAEAIVESLKSSGILTTDISVLMPDLGGNRDFSHEHNTKAPEGATIGGSAGGIAGGALGLLAGIGALAIPGVGPFIAAGPIMAALSGAAVGATIGGVAGALVGMGMPEYEAKQYEDKLKNGNILISVHTNDSDEADRIKEIMEDADAEDVSITSEAGVSKSERSDRPSQRL